MKSHLPPDIPGEASDLGALISEHRFNMKQSWVQVIIAVTMIPIMMALSIYSAITAVTSKITGLWILPGMLGLLTLAVIGMLWHVLQNWNARLLVFQDGFIHVQNKQANVVRWEHVAAVWQNVTKVYLYGVIHADTLYQYTIQLDKAHGQRKFVFGKSFSDIEVLGENIQNQASRFLVPLMAKALKADRVILFGKIGINKTGIIKGSNVLPWHEVREVYVNQGKVYIKKKGRRSPWLSTPVAKMPNLYAFLYLVNRILSN
jgi:hypothetical protein